MSTENNFKRSNINAKTLQITDPGRSSFNLGHKNELSIPFGKIIPVSHRILLPSDSFQGSIKPNFHLERIATPSIGPTRLDTHTFVVNFRRINNQMRQNLEKGENFFPSFNMNHLLIFLPLSPIAHVKQINVSEYLLNLFKGKKSVREVITTFWTDICSAISILKDNSVVINYSEYYQYDKLLELYEYYITCRKQWETYIQNNPQDDILDLYNFCIIPFYKPWAGESSLFDYLGYPVITKYNRVIAEFESYKTKTLVINWSEFSNKIIEYLGSSSSDKNEAKDLVNKFFLCQIYFTYPTNAIVKHVLDLPTTFSELPIRAYYAVWYDYLRNWHIEDRAHILDPDNFSNSSVIAAPVESMLNNTNYWCGYFFHQTSLILLRSRDYNSDFLTTIQTDDAFRHVYSPIFQTTSQNTPFKIEGSTQTVDGSTINGIYLPDALGELFSFPSDNPSGSSQAYSVVAQDLQTMRRAGMLEKWLARNYYFPDTYVGRLQARFGVRPSDYEVLVSNYLGGSETFINGTELIANMSTSETIVGSRNLKADMSTQDIFSGTVSDYSYLISVVSTVPIVSYNVLHPSVSTIDFVQFPQPEFATDTRTEARVSDFLRGFEIKPFIGYVPRYYMFRTSADETHGRYLTDYRSFNWFRDSYSMAQQNFEFSLNPYSLRVNLPLDAFIGLQRWDDFAYGDCDCQLVVNRALPAAIEII